jgi:hypothetical protein
MDRLAVEGHSVSKLASLHRDFVVTIQRRCMAHSDVAANAVKGALGTVDRLCASMSALAGGSLTTAQASSVPRRCWVVR